MWKLHSYVNVYQNQCRSSWTIKHEYILCSMQHYSHSRYRYILGNCISNATFFFSRFLFSLFQQIIIFTKCSCILKYCCCVWSVLSLSLALYTLLLSVHNAHVIFNNDDYHAYMHLSSELNSMRSNFFLALPLPISTFLFPATLCL